MPPPQALAREDLSAMQLVQVPDLWPPPDSAPAAALVQQPRSLPGEHRLGAEGDAGYAWTRQFAVLLAEVLTGARPPRQLLPWLSQRGTVHLHRLLPLFGGGQRARVQRVLTAQPSPDVIEMTLIVTVGPRTRALAVRLARAEPTPPPQWRSQLPVRAAALRPATSAQWLCTDIEAG